MYSELKNYYIWKLMQAFEISEDFFKRNYFELASSEIGLLWDIASLVGIRGNSKGWTKTRVLFYRMKEYVSNLPF